MGGLCRTAASRRAGYCGSRSPMRHNPEFGIMSHAALPAHLREVVPGRGQGTGADPDAPGAQSVQTTERYLGTRQDLVHAPNDGIKLRVAVNASEFPLQPLPLRHRPLVWESSPEQPCTHDYLVLEAGIREDPCNIRSGDSQTGCWSLVSLLR
jgi:hypothetical protein